MLINFDVLVNKYGLPKGIIHIGAHHLQERESYNKFNLTNTLWIEANPKIVKYVLDTIVLSEQEQLLNYAIVDTEEKTIELNVTSFDQSSSILKLGTHKQYYPQIDVVESIQVPAKTMKSLIEDNIFDIERYNFLNIDIQGAELKALKSFENYLQKIDFIYTEVNKESLYEGCCLLEELDEFLGQRGYKQVELVMTSANWGDAFYIKK